MPEAAPVPVPTSAALAETVRPRCAGRSRRSAGDVIATFGAAASMLIVAAFVASLLPATSHDAYRTVVVWVTGKGPV